MVIGICTLRSQRVTNSVILCWSALIWNNVSIQLAISTILGMNFFFIDSSLSMIYTENMYIALAFVYGSLTSCQKVEDPYRSVDLNIHCKNSTRTVI